MCCVLLDPSCVLLVLPSSWKSLLLLITSLRSSLQHCYVLGDILVQIMVIISRSILSWSCFCEYSLSLHCSSNLNMSAASLSLCSRCCIAIYSTNCAKYIVVLLLDVTLSSPSFSQLVNSNSHMVSLYLMVILLALSMRVNLARVSHCLIHDNIRRRGNDPEFRTIFYHFPTFFIGERFFSTLIVPPLCLNKLKKMWYYFYTFLKKYMLEQDTKNTYLTP